MSPPTARERFQAALAGEPVDRPPVWFMRQAGRCLPEYREIREDHSFLDVCNDAKLAREVTLQPVDRFGVDVGVVFSDILLPLQALGLEVRYESGVGPIVEDPIREPERVEALPEPERPRQAARVVDAVRQARPELGVVGFAGAPFTLACYAIEGGSPGRYEHVNRFQHEHPEAFARLLERLADLAGPSIEAQAEAGADAVQLFDTHAEILAPQDYAGPPREATQRALDHVGQDEAATIAFARGSAHLLDPMRELDADALSLDWRVDLLEAARHVEGQALQGNLDPGLLVGPPELARQRTRQLVEDGREAEGHVVNLGHGVTPNANLATIQAIVDEVQEAAR